MITFKNLLSKYPGLQEELEADTSLGYLSIVGALSDQERLVLLTEKQLTFRTRYNILMHISDTTLPQEYFIELAEASMQHDLEVSFWTLRLLRCQTEDLPDSLKVLYRKLATQAQIANNTRIELLALLDSVDPLVGDNQNQVIRINALIQQQRLVWITYETLDDWLNNGDEICTVVDFLEQTGQHELKAELERKYIDDEDEQGPQITVVPI